MIIEEIEPQSKDIVFVYTTCESADEARSIGLSVIERKFAISADYWAIGSVYPWHGVIQDTEQYMLMLTTQKSLSEKLIKSISTIHSYSAPMITRLDTAMMNPTYTFWVDNTLNNPKGYISEEEKRHNDEIEEDDGYHYGKLK